MVQDPPVPPSEILLLPPLNYLYTVNVRNQDPPQPGDSRPVMSPSQHVLSRQMMRNWQVWNTNIQTSNNPRMMHQLTFHSQKTIPGTCVEDLDPRPCDENVHESVLSFEMTTIEPRQNPTHTVTWKPLGFHSHIKSRTNDDRFPLSLWEVWF
jgi:hypothetical protein